MRGRKHPLEIFRLNGKTFVTTREEAETRRRSPPVAPDEPDLERGPAESAAEADSGPNAGPNGGRSGAGLADPIPPGRRTKRTITMARSGGAQRRAAARSRLVTQWSIAVAGLVLVAGLAYAAKLWLFSGNGAPTDGLALQRDESIKADWPDHALEVKDDAPAPGNDAGEAAATGKGAKEVGTKAPVKSPAAAPAAVREYWVVAASVKLNEKERSKKLSDLRKELFKNEEQKLHKGLDAEIGRYGFRVQTVATNQKAGEFVLRVGCATTADDANLKAMLSKVIKLGGSFKNALIRDYPPATTK